MRTWISVVLLCLSFVAGYWYFTRNVDLHREQPLSREQKQAMKKERDQLHQQARQLEKESKWAEAIAPYEKALAIERVALVPTDPEIFTSLEKLAQLQEHCGDFVTASKLRQEVLTLHRSQPEKDRGQVVQAQRALADLELRSRWTVTQRQDYARAHVLHQQGEQAYQQRRYAQALEAHQQALALRKVLHGEQHADYATSLYHLADAHTAQYAYGRAEPLYQQARAIRKQVLGEQHPDYVRCLDSLGNLHELQGTYDRAVPLFQQALALRKQALGEKHVHYAYSLNQLAGLYKVQGAYERAAPLQQEAVAIYKQTYGEKSTEYARCLSELAWFYRMQGKQDRAALDRAAPLFQQVCAIYKQTLGEQSPDYALNLQTLATVYHEQGASDRAEPLLRQALAIYKATQGEQHANYAYSLQTLADLYHDRGAFARAAPLYQQALAIRKQLHGAKGLSYAYALSQRADRYQVQGVHDRAEPLRRQALQILAAQLDESALALTELDQLAHAGNKASFFSSYLNASREAQQPAAEVYALVLPWKGAVTTRQQLTRMARTALKEGDTSTAQLFQRLEAVARQLARLTQETPDPSKLPNLATRLQQLSEERDQLEKDLARTTESFRKLRQCQQVTPAQLQQALPADAALLDYVIYPREEKAGKAGALYLAAFVVRRDHIERLELGELAEVETAIDRFIAGIQRRVAPVQGKEDPAVLLRERLWLPLGKHLAGVKTVLIAPSGPLCRLPFAALPTAKGDQFLLEELAMAIIPVPQLVPQLLESRQGAAAPPSLLVLGDVNFDARSAVAASTSAERAAWERQRAGEPLQWGALPGTRAEMLAIAASFRQAAPEGQLTSLRDSEATEAAVRQLAGQFDYLHLATHGYFAAEKHHSALQGESNRQPLADQPPKLLGYHPGLLSGLVLAGANKPTADGDDEVLTALEVGHMNLSKVKLAVLSACETGLGKVAGGEGVLGLQRAFQMAGARSTVTSYWKVDDDATCRLMERFYENHWQKQQGTLAALREAQLWMLREGRSDPAVQRGVERVNAPAAPKDGRLPPYYWAAFVLAGDWR